MATTRLTKLQIDVLAYDQSGPTKKILHDTQVPGLGVRVYASGKKSYVLNYRVNGRQRCFTLGSIAAFRSVSEAREEANARLIALHRDGIDPLVEKALGRSRRTSLAALLERYIEEYLATEASFSTLRDAKSSLKNHLPSTVSRIPAIDVNRGTIRRLHKKLTVRNGKYAANRTVQLLKAAFNWAEAEEDGTLPVGHRNPCTRVKLNPERSRDRVVHKHDLPALLAAINAEQNPYLRAYFMLLMYTACRKSELLGLLWSNVDIRNERLTF